MEAGGMAGFRFLGHISPWEFENIWRPYFDNHSRGKLPFCKFLSANVKKYTASKKIYIDKTIIKKKYKNWSTFSSQSKMWFSTIQILQGDILNTGIKENL